MFKIITLLYLYMLSSDCYLTEKLCSKITDTLNYKRLLSMVMTQTCLVSTVKHVRIMSEISGSQCYV